MKATQFRFQKFHRKYVFLQTSLHDFLSWRSSESFNEKQYSLAKNLNSYEPRQSFLVEQDKINFEDYWKSSEKKKLQTALRTFNKEFRSFQKTPFVSSKDSFQNEQNLQKGTAKKERMKTSTVKKIRLSQYHKKRKTQFLSSSMRDVLLPKSDVFLNFSKTNVFSHGNIGEFFPKKKVFQQYWIFPFVGFAMFFSTNSFFFPLLRRTNVRENIVNIQTEYSQRKNQHFFGEMTSLDQNGSHVMNQNAFHVFGKKQSLFARTSQNLSFFYPNKLLKSKVFEFQDFEKREFEHFSNFYWNLFQNSLIFDTLHQNQQIFSIKSSFDFFEKTLPFGGEKKNFRKGLDVQRNALKWQWFSQPFQSCFSLSSFEIHLPQKAQFFTIPANVLTFEGLTSSKKNDVQRHMSPIFEFSKTCSLFQEFEKNVRIQANRIFTEHSFLPPSSETFQTVSHEDFFTNLNNEDMQFLNSLESKKIPFLDSTFLNDSNVKQQQNMFFLQKWFQTQNFYKFIKNEGHSKPLIKKNSKFDNLDYLSQLDILYIQKFFHNSFTQSSSELFHFVENLSNFQKFAELMNTERVQNASVQKSPFFEKSSGFSHSFKTRTFEYFLYQYYKSYWKTFGKVSCSQQNSRRTLSQFKKSNKRYLTNTWFQFFENVKATKKMFTPVFTNQRNMFENDFFQKNEKQFSQSSKNLFLKNRVRLKFQKLSEQFVRLFSRDMETVFVFNNPLLFDFSNKKRMTNTFPTHSVFGDSVIHSTISQNSLGSNYLNNSGDSVFSSFHIPENHISSKYFQFAKTLSPFSFTIPSLKAYFSLNMFQKFSLDFSHKNFFKTEKSSPDSDCKTKVFVLNDGFDTFRTKFELVERIFEKTLKYFQNSAFLTLSNSEAFQNYFVFEKQKHMNPLVFRVQKTKPFSSNNSFVNTKQSNNDFFHQSLRTAQFKKIKELKIHAFLNNSTNLVFLKQKAMNFNSSKRSADPSSFHTNHDFLNFQARKFEKIFQTFLLPFQRENNQTHTFFSKLSNHQKFVKTQKTKDSFVQRKFEDDNLLLQTISSPGQRWFSQTKTYVFIPVFGMKDGASSFEESKNILQKKISTNSVSIKKVRHRKNIEKLMKQDSFPNTSKISEENKKLSASFILKRDGFGSLSKVPSIQLKTQNQGNEVGFVQSSRSFLDAEKGTLRRLEKEKSIQKKRRMKKQKLETRRRKKRKRFFPRPLWLRFHLYKKFLKTRHPNGFHSKVNLSNHKQSLQTKESWSKNPKTIRIVFKTSNQSESLFFKNRALIDDSTFQKQWTSLFRQSADSKISNSLFQNSTNIQKSRCISKSIVEKTSLRMQGKDSFVSLLRDVQKNSHFVPFEHTMKLYRKNTQKWGFFWKNGFQERMFYKKFVLHSSACDTTNFFSRFQSSSPISQNIDHYKISGQILSEFLRLSWKSYWFQANCKSYTNRITQNFRKMQHQEGQNVWSDARPQNLAQDVRVSFSDVSLFQKHNPNDLILRKSMLKKLYWYSNIHSSLESTLFDSNSLNAIGHNNLDFRKIQNFPEYNRILYARVSEILRNVKSFETNNDQYLGESAKRLRIPKRKNESIFSNIDFFTKLALFSENFQIPTQPTIPAFSIFSSLFQNHSVKPTGEFPTLRAFWALSQTNLFQFQERNAVRNLWTLKKRKEILESRKGTKHILRFFKKHNPIQTGDFPYFSNISKVDPIFFTTVQNNILIHKSMFSKNLHLRLIFDTDVLKTKKTAFTMKSEFADFINQLDKISFQKYQLSEKKSSVFGVNQVKQNSKISVRSLKYHLLSTRAKDSLKNSLIYENETPQLFSRNFDAFHSSLPFQLEKQQNLQASAKSSLHFWWLHKNSHTFDLLFSSQRKNIPNFEIFDFSNPKKYHSTNDPEFRLSDNFQESQDLSLSLSKALMARQDFNHSNNAFATKLQIFWFGAFVFHLAILFTLFKIPEIRTIFKFQCIIFYKVFNSIVPIIFSLFHFLNKYRKLGNVLLQKFANAKNSFFFTKKGYTPFFSSPDFLLSSFHSSNIFDSSLSMNIQSSFGLKNLLYTKFLKQNMFFLYSENFVSFQQPKSFVIEFLNRFSCVSSFLNTEVRFIPTHNDVFSNVFGFQTKKFGNFENRFVFSSNVSKFHQVQKGIFLSKLSMPVFKKSSIEDEVYSFGSLDNTSALKYSSKKPILLKPNEKILARVALSFLMLGKGVPSIFYAFVYGTSKISTNVLDLLEHVLFSIYKFLEKPAELMIEWIALIFLIEWSSDMATFVPDTLDISYFKSSQKFVRPFKAGSIVFTFLSSKNNVFLASLSNQFGTWSPSSVFSFSNSFGVSLVFSFLLQKRMLYFFENFSSVLLQPDIDILVRQKKGMIFWDIWAEILLKAAEKYNVNIPSLVTLKEEQELLIEKLIQDPHFLNTVRSNSSFGHDQASGTILFQGEQMKQQSLASFIENFLIKERPTHFGDMISVSNKQFELSQILSVESDFVFQKMFPKLKNGTETNNLFATKNFQVFQKNLQSHIGLHPIFSNSVSSPPLHRWLANQYGTYQGPETDLFIDLHPPKSLQHIQFFKYYEPAQYTVGTLICQIFSGIFSKQVSKNILVIGAPGTAKTLFIQALAGETEMKIITDNAYRYSMVQRGVAVGMKYLRDVFDALALQTPCFFLMEHIHVIGSKRPLLISDDENVKAIQFSFGLEQQEVHESNQMIYQLNRHAISDYKRPYKGDFSMGIPTNVFVQNFYERFEKHHDSLFKNSQFSSGGSNFVNRSAPVYPLPIDSIEHSLFHQGISEKEKADLSFQNSFETQNSALVQSLLQIPKQQIFAPPATSPFTILMMKQQKKLKPKKIVPENSWGGLSADQLISYQKESFSVRAKVALLADMTMNLSRGKLDMITDLLVIIDSVRSNRGFVVFATTHLPSLLDPALRRPGRFDETLSLAQSPNFFNRFEILKMNLQNSLSTLDFVDSSVITENFSELDLLSFLNRTKLSFFHEYKYTEIRSKFDKTPVSQKLLSLPQNQEKRILSHISPSKAFQQFSNTSLFVDVLSRNSCVQKINPSTIPFEKSSTSFLRDEKLRFYTILPKGPSHTLNFAYTKIGIFFAESNLFKDPYAFVPITLDKKNRSLSKHQKFLGNILYNSHAQHQLQLMVFLSGKISEFFVQKNVRLLPAPSNTLSVKMRSSSGFSVVPKFVQSEISSFNVFQKKFVLFPSKKFVGSTLSKFLNLQTFLSTSNESGQNDENHFKNVFANTQYSQQKLLKNNFFWTTFGIDDIWRSATPFLLSIFQKRFLFKKNLLLSKMLFFENKNQQKLPPSPPNSSILMPAKKYENFKRTEADFIQKPHFSIQEKIQIHQQQRFLKQLYNIPVQQYFHSETILDRKTSFSSAFQEVAYFDSSTRKSSSSSFYYTKYLNARHRFSTVNQWWNGLLPEHNIETTYLSDVDWRTMFGTTDPQHEKSSLSKKSGSSAFSQKQANLLKKSTTSVFEFVMDFPDAEQYYNPRNRRWYFHGNTGLHKSKNSSSWLSFDLDLQYEICYHYLMCSFHETFEFFDNHRELLDFFVFQLLKKGCLKEFDYITGISRFQKIQ